MSYIGQKEDEWNAAQAKKARKAKRRAKMQCPECKKRYTNLKAHMKDAHDLQIKIVPQPKYVIEYN